MASSGEEVVWKGTSSQLTNWKTYVGAGLLAAGIVAGGVFFPPTLALLAIPILWAAWNFLVVRCRIFELTSERLRLYEGVLSRRIDEIELYRVKDTVIEQPLVLRIFGLSNLLIETSDRSHHRVDVLAVRDAMGVREKLRGLVEVLRDKKRVREIDFDGAESDEFEGDLEAV